MNISLPSMTNTSILGESANADNVVSLESPKDWGLNNQISGYCYESPKREITSHVFEQLIHNLKT